MTSNDPLPDVEDRIRNGYVHWSTFWLDYQVTDLRLGSLDAQAKGEARQSHRAYDSRRETKASDMWTASCLGQKCGALLKHERAQDGDMGEVAWAGGGTAKERSERSGILSRAGFAERAVFRMEETVAGSRCAAVRGCGSDAGCRGEASGDKRSH